MNEEIKFHDYGPRGVNKKNGFNVVIFDETVEYFFNETRQILESYKMRHDLEYPDHIFPKEKTEFQKRQEWLDGFRKKHQRKGKK